MQVSGQFQTEPRLNRGTSERVWTMKREKYGAAADRLGQNSLTLARNVVMIQTEFSGPLRG